MQNGVSSLIVGGFRPNVAKVIATLLVNNRMYVNEIQEQTGLPQPSVSTALTELQKMQWVVEIPSDLPVLGKGRPKIHYQLRATSDDIVIKSIETIDDKIHHLRQHKVELEKLTR